MQTIRKLVKDGAISLQRRRKRTSGNDRFHCRWPKMLGLASVQENYAVDSLDSPVGKCHASSLFMWSLGCVYSTCVWGLCVKCTGYFFFFQASQRINKYWFYKYLWNSQELTSTFWDKQKSFTICVLKLIDNSLLIVFVCLNLRGWFLTKII
jgi:hypothetical protein